LAIAMDQGDQIKAVSDGVLKFDFLISALALIDGIFQNREFERELSIDPDFVGLFKRVVGRTVIDNQDFGVVDVQRFRNFRQHILNGFFVIKGDDEDQKFFGHVTPLSPSSWLPDRC